MIQNHMWLNIRFFFSFMNFYILTMSKSLSFWLVADQLLNSQHCHQNAGGSSTSTHTHTPPPIAKKDSNVSWSTVEGVACSPFFHFSHRKSQRDGAFVEKLWTSSKDCSHHGTCVPACMISVVQYFMNISFNLCIINAELCWPSE